MELQNYTCKKVFTDFPFAHRQHTHDGHCRLVHGHNWSFEIVFGCLELDSNGFVVDFGKLAKLRTFLLETFDHTLVLSEDDPQLEWFRSHPQLWNVKAVPSASAEGLAKYVCEKFDTIISSITNGRACVTEVTVYEDSRNSATYYGD